MKLETFEEGARLLNKITFLENKLERLDKAKKELELKEGIKLEMGWDEIKIPFDVVKDWFIIEENRILNEIEILQKEFDNLS